MTDIKVNDHKVVNMNEPVLAMYDVRGIQKYIFKTIKVQDARGASELIENIIVDAMESAISVVKIRSGYENIKTEIKWFDENGPIKYSNNDNDVQILFSGGGNASFLFSSGKLCLEINKLMSKYILENTYSLQLAIAFINKTENYSNDYSEVNKVLASNKAKMINSSPLGTLPIMKMEIKTGYPIETEDNLSKETSIKKKKDEKKSSIEKKVDKKFDHYVTKKGKDSNLAVVHIDGNNMGLRIRGLVQDIIDYEKAVNKVREISFNISNSYKSVFNEMVSYYNETGSIDDKENNNFVLKILVAGDDITYICNAGIAIDTVNYYCNAISDRTMIKNEDGLEEIAFLKKYGFSVCAGIAFFTSHFPFYVAYDVAESCCDSAKKYAKANKIEGVISNWLDYQICKNIQAIDLENVRAGEYVTAENEILYRRPYYVSIKQHDNARKCYSMFESKISDTHKLSNLEEAIIYFKNTNNLPRSISKEIRNIYPEGSGVIESYVEFLKSRKHEMPDGKFDMYLEENGSKIAKWYDALEILDYYTPQFKYYDNKSMREQEAGDSDE